MATRANRSLIVVNKPTTSSAGSERRRCSAHALSFPLLHESRVFSAISAPFHGAWPARLVERFHQPATKNPTLDAVCRNVSPWLNPAPQNRRWLSRAPAFFLLQGRHEELAPARRTCPQQFVRCLGRRQAWAANPCHPSRQASRLDHRRSGTRPARRGSRPGQIIALSSSASPRVSEVIRSTREPIENGLKA